jgi:hypothetical protein
VPIWPRLTPEQQQLLLRALSRLLARRLPAAVAAKGYVHARHVGRMKHLVVWADAEERELLCRLRDAFGPGRTSGYPVKLTRPKARPDAKSEALRDQDAGLDP